VNWGRLFSVRHGFYSSVIVADFDVKSVRPIPSKADPPLIVEADAMLTPALAFQRPQAIARRRSQAPQFDRGIQLPRFSTSHLLKRHEAQNTLALVKLFGVSAAKGPDYCPTV
jgi:hypothetical protein